VGYTLVFVATPSTMPRLETENAFAKRTLRLKKIMLTRLLLLCAMLLVLCADNAQAGLLVPSDTFSVPRLQ
jgi:hypothetical protein